MSTQLLLLYGLAVMIGIMGGVHVPINGALGDRIQSPLLATVLFYAIGLTVIGSAFLLAGNRAALMALKEAPRWYFLAGAISAVVVGSSTFLIPRLGAVNPFAIVIALQMISRMVISHYGWLESPMSPISPFKILGALMLLAGAVLVVRN